MNFEADLIDCIKHLFDRVGIRYKDSMNARDFAARYFETRVRRIVPMPRNVHFSEEIHQSLGSLVQEKSGKPSEEKLDALRAVFLIRDLLCKGESVTKFLSKGVNELKKTDGLLWDFGMHHFHLSTELKCPGGFVKRSDFLLFAIITGAEAYFVDVRPHHDSEGLVWVRRDLLDIVYSNWPELIEYHVLQGGTGDALTDKQRKELRKKNVNYTIQLGSDAVFSIGGGMTGNGSSLVCKVLADKLLYEIERQQVYFDTHHSELLSALKDKGIAKADEAEFELVLLDSLTLSNESIDCLRDERCLSRDLVRMGFVIVEATTRSSIVFWSDE